MHACCMCSWACCIVPLTSLYFCLAVMCFVFKAGCRIRSSTRLSPSLAADCFFGRRLYPVMCLLIHLCARDMYACRFNERYVFLFGGYLHVRCVGCLHECQGFHHRCHHGDAHFMPGASLLSIPELPSFCVLTAFVEWHGLESDLVRQMRAPTN